MATDITQTDHPAENISSLRIEGEMFADDAELVLRLARNIVQQSGRRVLIDLADLDFIDSEAASILNKLTIAENIEITGVEIFLQTAIDQAEGRG